MRTSIVRQDPMGSSLGRTPAIAMGLVAVIVILSFIFG